MSGKDELKILIPDETIETSQGAIVLKPFKFKDFSTALAIVNRYVEIFANSEDTMSIVNALMANAGENTLLDVASLIELASSSSKTVLDELNYDEVIYLLSVVVEQNLDFFARIGKKLTKKTESETIAQAALLEIETIPTVKMDGVTASVA